MKFSGWVRNTRNKSSDGDGSPSRSTYYSDAIMSAMMFLITDVLIVFAQPFVQTQINFRVIGLCEGNPPVTGGFPHKGPVTRKMFPFDEVIVRNVFFPF